ncbi:helix-turn-helix domain-containing protein [Acrocarpospora sp. B8E8]|uniref:helix-turn-helix transcriptional regulator n=1 Tax=Acrocarpospora sp. B8E8 TaxID=3153572 RepID=UPI00325D5B41
MRKSQPPSGGRRPLATEDDLAEFLDKPKGTLRNWRYRGIGPTWARLEGGSVRYRWADVERWLDQQSRGKGGKAA